MRTLFAMSKQLQEYALTSPPSRCAVTFVDPRNIQVEGRVFVEQQGAQWSKIIIAVLEAAATLWVNPQGNPGVFLREVEPTVVCCVLDRGSQAHIHTKGRTQSSVTPRVAACCNFGGTLLRISRGFAVCSSSLKASCRK